MGDDAQHEVEHPVGSLGKCPLTVEIVKRLEDSAALRLAQHIQQTTHKGWILNAETKIENITHKQSYF